MTRIPEPRQATEGLTGYSVGELNYLWKRLDEGQREYIALFHKRARELHQQATAAWNKRASRLSYLLDYCKANRYTEHGTREKIAVDWAFNDANDDWLRFCQEISRCNNAIDTELKMSSLQNGVRNNAC